jgi:hypothetical protein
MLRPAAVYLCLLGLLLLSIPSALRAGEEEFDHARWKLQLNGWVSSPTGYFNGKNGNGYFDVQRDFGFGNYVTFAGRVDWRFKRKHHLFFVTTPVISSRTTTVTRTITWQGQTYDVGAQVNAKIDSLFFTPGYQYDFFRLRQFWLGFLANVNWLIRKPH